MPGNSIGQMFRVTTFGESHGVALGCIIDGCPPQLKLSAQDIQADLERRSPGQSKYTSQRRESDQVQILSGVFEGQTTGTPIALLIPNHDAKAKDYTALQHVFRPGHGDFSYQAKYGIRDHNGGGRASARETVARVAAGAIAKKYLAAQGIAVQAIVAQIGHIKADTLDFTQNNELNFADPSKIVQVAELIDSLRRDGDSIGAELAVVIRNAPAGLGEPVFDRLDADLAHAMMSINAVKGVELGAGFACVQAKGSEFRDEILPTGFVSNHAGGVLAGISTGQNITMNVAFKPASSIRVPGRTVDLHNNATEVVTTGRHDPCVGIRAVPIVEAMAAIVILDHLLRNRGQNGHVVKNSRDSICGVSVMDVV